MLNFRIKTERKATKAKGQTCPSPYVIVARTSSHCKCKQQQQQQQQVRLNKSLLKSTPASISFSDVLSTDRKGPYIPRSNAVNLSNNLNSNAYSLTNALIRPYK